MRRVPSGTTAANEGRHLQGRSGPPYSLQHYGFAFFSGPGTAVDLRSQDVARQSRCDRHRPSRRDTQMALTDQLNCMTSTEVKDKITNRSSHELEQAIGLWLLSFLLVAVLSQLLFSLSYFSLDLWSKMIYRSAVPLFFCLLIVLAALEFDRPKKHFFKYVLFFSVTITSALRLTKTLTGSHAESGSILLYGLAFYTPSIAYLLHSTQLSANSIAICSNPLLLITGPIATCFGSIHHYSFKKRFKYFFPYILIGLFLQQAI